MALKELLSNLSEEAQKRIADALPKDEPTKVDLVVTKFTALEGKELPQAFVDVDLDNGLTIQVEPDLQVGAVATVVIEGETVAVPEGAHTLTDGTIIEVGLDGQVMAITPLEEEEMEEAPKPEDPERAPKKVITREEVESIFSEMFEAHEAKIMGVLEDKFSAAADENKATAEEIKVLSEVFNAIVEEIGATPQEAPKHAPKTQVNKVSAAQKLRRKISSFKNQNK